MAFDGFERISRTGLSEIQINLVEYIQWLTAMRREYTVYIAITSINRDRSSKISEEEMEQLNTKCE